MSRTRWRISRGLVALLLIGSVAGLMWWLRGSSRLPSASAPMLAAPANAQVNTSPNALASPATPVSPPAAVTQVGQTLPAPQPGPAPWASTPSASGAMKTSTPATQPALAAAKNLPSSPPAAVAQMVSNSIQSSSAMALRYATTVTPAAADPTTGQTAGQTAGSPTTQPSRLTAAAIVPFPLPAPPPVLTLNTAAASGPPGVLADSGAKAQAGELLAARKMLNDALVSGKLDLATAAAARAQIAELNQTIVFSTQKFPGDEYGGVYAVRPGDMMRRIAEQYGVTWELLCRVNGMADPRHLRSDSTLKVIQGPFSAVVSKRAFTLDLYLGSTPGSPGSMYVCTFPVGLGREDSTTPTGTWMCEIHRKLKDPTYYSPRGEGIVRAGDPKNPLGHRWIGLVGIDGQAVGQQSYGIHGTIDDDSIGKTASLGCIRMHNADVELVFDLLVEGKSIVVVRD